MDTIDRICHAANWHYRLDVDGVTIATDTASPEVFDTKYCVLDHRPDLQSPEACRKYLLQQLVSPDSRFTFPINALGVQAGIAQGPKPYLLAIRAHGVDETLPGCQEQMIWWPPASKLHMAVYFKKVAVIKFLLKSGMDVNVKDPNGCTPLDWAQTDEIRELLRKHGGKPSGK